MEKTVYFVNYYLHNKTNYGWAYKVVNKYTNPDTAEKAYYAELENYVGSDTYDIAIVSLTDSFDNKIMSRRWTPYVEQAEE